jgi:plastocyanin
MRPTRRDLLAFGAAGLATGLAGCSGESGGAAGEPGGSDSGSASGGADDSESGDAGGLAATDVAVAAEWNAMRARAWDALALGVGGQAGAGATVAQETFARFEGASGEYGAHETLETTSESSYEEFEEALGELRSAGLDAGNVDRAREEATIASDRLAEAQRTLVGDATANLFDLQLLGVAAQDAAMLAAAGNAGAAGTVAADALARFEAAPVHDALESASGEAYEAFEGALEGVTEAAEAGDAEGVRTRAAEAFEAALDGSYALAGGEAVAGAGHLAALQARGWDAAALAGAGGPSTDYAHAAALTVYRARASDAHWLAARGETDAAATMVQEAFAHFEGARAHEALEEASGEAYEAFEAGLSDLQRAIEDGNSSGVDEAAAAVDESLVTGIEALAGADAALLEAAFFRLRFADARERYRMGQNNVAASLAQGLFERFEADELGLHESVEETSESLYTSFEEEHLSGLIEAFETTDDAGVETHYEGVQSTLLDYATQAGSTATVSGGEAAYMAARGFDAAAVDALGNDGRAQAIAQGAFEHFEAGAGGFHEALEAADEALYGSFEEALGAVASAAGDGDGVAGPARTFNAEAVVAAYAVVERGGGNGEAAATVLRDTFAHFEEARVHELIEAADHNAYETFEAHLDAYLAAVQDGGDVAAAASSFADAAQYAQFAVVGRSEKVPLDLDLAGSAAGESGGEGGDSDLSGGPNVVEGVPDDADHVVEQRAVAYDPAELTVSRGDTVAFPHAAGEAHTVFAYEDAIPDGADYWASGGFDGESAAREGWENGEGAVQAGQSYVHTFETTGTHEYFCAPHEAAGMVGSITVE